LVVDVVEEKIQAAKLMNALDKVQMMRWSFTSILRNLFQ